jgi:hypothetical protein
MMKKIFLCLSIIISILLGGCKSNELTAKDKLFSNYLEENFSLQIPEVQHYFIMVPKFGCKGCMKKDLARLSKYVQNNPNKKFTLITSTPEIIPVDMKKGMPFFVDSLDKIDKINLGITNVTIIKTTQGKIRKQHSFSVNDTSSFCTIIDDL